MLIRCAIRPQGVVCTLPLRRSAHRSTGHRARQADVVPSAPATMDRTMDLLQQSREMNAFEVRGHSTRRDTLSNAPAGRSSIARTSWPAS